MSEWMVNTPVMIQTVLAAIEDRVVTVCVSARK